MTGIYKIISPSGRVYIGQSVNIQKRFKGYKNLSNCKSQTKLYNSFKKYGVENHIFKVIEECNPEDLNTLEGYYQDIYNCVKTGLNCRRVSYDEASGYLSEETKRKISETKLKKHSKISIPVINTKTGKVYKSIRRASLDSSYSISKLKTNLSGKHQNTTEFEYLNKDLKSKTSYTVRNTKIVLDTETGVFYESYKELSENLGLKYSYVKSKLAASCKYKTTFEKYLIT